jgi:signal transduction histidine kinase
MPDHDSVRILYIEDDPGLARLFQRKLERAGHTVDLAGDGAQGLSLYDQTRYDIVAVDHKLPVYDGLEVLRQMAQRGPLPPTIVVTGNGNEQLAVEALKLGASDYIVKDADGNYLDLLPAVIDQVLLQRRLVAEREQAVAALQKRNLELASLNDVSQALTATLDLNQVLERLLPPVATIIGAEGALVYLCGEVAADPLNCQAIYYRGNYFAPNGPHLEPGRGFSGWAAQNAQSLVVNDAAADPRYLPEIDRLTGFTTCSILAVPLRAREQVIGVLEVVNKQNGDFDPDDLSLVETLAASAAIAIDNAQLVEALRERTDDLQARNEELDAFAHTVAHDLKNPLSQANGFSTILSKEFDELPPDETRQYLQFIAQSTQKMESIINELLLLAGVRKTTVEAVPLEMAAIVSEARQRLAYMIEQTGAQLTMPADWPVALGHGPWIEEVWVNYLANALKYGGQPPHIEIGGETTDSTARFWVRDGGPGLSVEDQSKLFRPFTQLNQVRTKGHGLGLSIVRRIVEKLGGQVGVESEPGQGSLFYFTLPRPR